MGSVMMYIGTLVGRTDLEQSFSSVLFMVGCHTTLYCMAICFVSMDTLLPKFLLQAKIHYFEEEIEFIQEIYIHDEI